jgi:hypothetical protein
MVAMTAPRKISRRTEIVRYSFGVKANVTILQSALVILATGFARPGRAGQGADTAAQAADALTYQCVGLATETVVGGAADGDVRITVEASEWPFANSTAGDLITIADIGKLAYLVDDQTVAKTSATSTRAAAGRITGVDSDGVVWVRVGPGLAI